MVSMRARKRVARKRGRAPAQGAANAVLPPEQRTGRRGRPPVPYYKYRTHCTERRVLVWLRYGGASWGEIVAGTNRRDSVVDKALATLMRAGVIVRPRPGWYELADPKTFYGG